MDFKDYFSRFNNHDFGYCSICNIESKLTFDHVPPQSCGNHGLYKINTFPEITKWQFSRNGLKFKTICANCNNVLLGSTDKDLAEFCDRVKTYLKGIKNNISYPNSYNIEINPQNIIKGVIGHLLAAKRPPMHSKEKPSGDYWEDLKDIFDGKNRPEYVICIGFHDYSTVNIFPFISIGRFGEMSNAKIFSTLSFFPLSFIITNERTFANRNKFIRLRFDLKNQYIDLRLLKHVSQKYPLDRITGMEAALFANEQNYVADRVSRLFF